MKVGQQDQWIGGPPPSQRAARLLLSDNSSISGGQDKKNVWQLSHMIREGEPDVLGVCDRELMRFP